MDTSFDVPGSPAAAHPARRRTAGLALLALGVVYGDIGTSPLYAVKETFNPEHGLPLTPENILGGVSAIFWSLMLIVTLKYVTLVLRADNHGEGGIMALLALATSSVRDRPRLARVLLAIGIAGAALFYGDAVLTPAISVLSAVEGLEVGTAAFKPYVVPLATVTLIALFAVQRHGTGVIGLCFGPICAMWFAALAVAGAANIAAHPEILRALDPAHALRFATGHGMASFVVLGSVLLAVTGAEALYADMGHFGSRAIRLAWFAVALPALVLNYFGQGALLLADPGALDNPFYRLYPDWALYPMVVLATLATVIASQATISGAYSLTQQAMQLGFLPRLTLHHTSSHVRGQIYMPAVNGTLLVIVAAAVVGFGSSSKLASAYGVAVMGTMLATTLLTYFVVTARWGYPRALVLAATVFFAAIDGTFFAAALHKVLDGGWFPLALGAAMATLMLTWRAGREALVARQQAAPPLAGFLHSLLASDPQRVAGTAIFLTASPGTTPGSLLHSLKHYRVLHECNVFLTVAYADTPLVDAVDRVHCERIADGCWAVTASFGFMERPDLAHALALCGPAGLTVDPHQVSYFVSREQLVAGRAARGIARLRERGFAWLARNAATITDFFRIPANRVVELGTRIEL
ncbi:MAG: potassium transporter Kup [Burkholderiales bacterium]